MGNSSWMSEMNDSKAIREEREELGTLKMCSLAKEMLQSCAALLALIPQPASI
jgi:hypothetical protein